MTYIHSQNVKSVKQKYIYFVSKNTLVTKISCANMPWLIHTCSQNVKSVKQKYFYFECENILVTKNKFIVNNFILFKSAKQKYFYFVSKNSLVTKNKLC